MKIRQHTRRLSAATLATAALATGLLTAPGAATAGPPAHTPVQAGTPGPAQPFELTDWDRDAYRGQVEVRRTPENRKPRTDDTLSGRVFEDRNQDSVRQPHEKGVAGVRVSNGEDVVVTDKHGRYELPVRENMTVFVTQPTGYRVPVDADNVPQFHYHHLPQGSPELKGGGIAPTGALPAAVNFPVVADAAMAEEDQRCLIGGDIQTYKQKEVEYARAGAFADLAARDDHSSCGILFIGDIVGDNHSLYPQTRELAGMVNGPAWFLPGNHDLDFDAKDSEHAFDTFRANLGPEYYSYDVGDTHVIALSSVEYPLEGKKGYNGSLDARQMEWLRNDIAATDPDKTIVLGTHVPLLSFADESSQTHQIDQLTEIYAMLEGREVVTVGGHTHSTEMMREGDLVAGWKNLFGIDGLPFDHLVAGAISGDWYSGRMLEAGYPTAIQRDGALPGVLTLDIADGDVVESFTVRGDDGSTQMALGLNTPAYRDWFAQNLVFKKKGGAQPLAEPLVVPADELGDSWLTANFFMGDTGSTVTVSIDGGAAAEAARTQPMRGEQQFSGVEYSDPTAVQEQLVHGGSLADRSMHLWRLPLPAGLSVGEHTAVVTATDSHGHVSTEELTFTVR